MNWRVACTLLALILASAPSVAPAQSTPVARVGFVDFDRVFRDSRAGRESQQIGRAHV